MTRTNVRVHAGSLELTRDDEHDMVRSMIHTYIGSRGERRSIRGERISRPKSNFVPPRERDYKRGKKKKKRRGIRDSFRKYVEIRWNS